MNKSHHAYNQNTAGQGTTTLTKNTDFDLGKVNSFVAVCCSVLQRVAACCSVFHTKKTDFNVGR